MCGKSIILFNTFTVKIHDNLCEFLNTTLSSIGTPDTLSTILGYNKYRLELTTLRFGPTNIVSCFFIVEFEFHMPLFHIDLCTPGGKKWSPKKNGNLEVNLKVKNYKIDWKDKRLNFHKHIMAYSYGPLQSSTDYH